MFSKYERVILAGIVVCYLVQLVRCDQLNQDQDVAEGRTFGHHFLKRISFAIIPTAFVVGVITTLLSALTVVSMNSLGVGVVLLVLAVSQILARTLPGASQPQPVAYSAPVPGPVPIVYHRDW
ncbi:protein apnoia-like [Malaya genurostris]|uniref:protein apnoia-like n=1 Tax=Malaya genurostris TaxID=325434 RepID=UPI0026F3CBA0|nr:protein apnoia-like [Malaya genurostris]XP_058455327.1 protein apnoia-like [Malaya genurostris]